jgi:hypothetical protein
MWLLEPQRLYVTTDCQTLGLHLVSVSYPKGEPLPKAKICSGQLQPGPSGHKGWQERDGIRIYPDCFMKKKMS